ncbi:NAD(P)-dependent oxidoreductase [Guptibacillus hwajinpoensis]|uniref:Glutamate synthase (NADPH/NADH) small chain n=1 Tax=Guptibacillus hwajinpoensis TaxID=208199 RepID=A0ABU0K450_9BACL|nr:NAD(P)-dependent oxidoreductase [Alkalihalobacillus hemicentroti]MDQ0483158.1 glutamate synthase (NADPH/NADH) small chain [Alkalihalobacillus hemicentroti]
MSSLESSIQKELQKNFTEVIPSLTNQEAFQESQRCLYCYDAPCITACPTGIDIPTFIKKIASGNMKGSAKTIMTANPVGASCSRVCPTEELCEGACVLNHSTKPILIGNLQRYATDWAIKNDQVLFKQGQPNGKKVAIVGGGPAGLSAARELALLGYDVTIYEAESEAGGLDTYGIVSFRLPKSVSLWEVEQVQNLGVTIKTGVKVGEDIPFNEIYSMHDRVILAIGMASVPNLNIPGEQSSGVYDAIELVKMTKAAPFPTELKDKKVVVIGAGNTAIDGATCSVRLGAYNVKILYRRSEQEMTAYDFEYEFAKQDGVEFRWLTQPIEILTNKDGKVEGIKCIRMQLLKAAQGERRRTVPVPDSEFIIECDAVIKAIGQKRHLPFIEELGLAHKEGVILINNETMETSNPKVYACGDVIFGKGQGEAMVVSAAQQGKAAAYHMHESLKESYTA